MAKVIKELKPRLSRKAEENRSRNSENSLGQSSKKEQIAIFLLPS